MAVALISLRGVVIVAIIISYRAAARRAARGRKSNPLDSIEKFLSSLPTSEIRFENTWLPLPLDLSIRVTGHSGFAARIKITRPMHRATLAADLGGKPG